MKDFAIEYVEPIVNEFWALHTPVGNKVILKELNVEAIFNSNHNPIEVFLLSKRYDCHFRGVSVYEFDKDLKDWCKCAETYEGELVDWQRGEYIRVMNLVRDKLIEKYKEISICNCDIG